MRPYQVEVPKDFMDVTREELVPEDIRRVSVPDRIVIAARIDSLHCIFFCFLQELVRLDAKILPIRAIESAAFFLLNQSTNFSSLSC